MRSVAEPATPSAPPPPRRRSPRLIRLLAPVVVYLLLGAAAALAVAGALAAWVDPRTGPSTSADAFDGEARWTATRWERVGGVYVLSERNANWSWSPRQATGPPNTPNPGDYASAWASQTPDGQEEWLELTYGRAVEPKALHVYESYNPGALVRVVAYKEDGTEVEAWRGKDPLGPPVALGVSSVPLAADFRTRRVRIYLDSKAVPGWNEVDAVALQAFDGEMQWAARARASSGYGAGAISPGAPKVMALVPAWSGLREPGAAFASGQGMAETRAAAAFGWPFLAIWASDDVIPVPPTFLGAPIFSTRLGPPPAATGGSSTLLPPPGSGSLFPASGPPAAPATTPLPTPRRVLWGGLMADAVLFATALALLRYLIAAPRRFLTEVSRMRRGRCIVCGYDLGYDFVRGCPECGWRRDRLAAAGARGAGENGRAGRGKGDETVTERRA